MHQLARESHSLQGDFLSTGFPLSAATITTRQAFPSLSESKACHQWQCGCACAQRYDQPDDTLSLQFGLTFHQFHLGDSLVLPLGVDLPMWHRTMNTLVKYGKHFPCILSTSPLCGDVETSHLHFLVRVSQHRRSNYCHHSHVPWVEGAWQGGRRLIQVSQQIWAEEQGNLRPPVQSTSPVPATTLIACPVHPFEWTRAQLPE